MEYIDKKMFLLLLIGKHHIRKSIENATNNNSTKKMVAAFNKNIVMKIVGFIDSDEGITHVHWYGNGTYGPCDRNES